MDNPCPFSSAWLLIWSAVLGAALGSFGNVLIWRLPRDESILKPPSHCPSCGHRIRFYDNIPLLSFLWLGGRCRDCKEPISLRYPATELASALLFTGAALKCGWSLATLFYGCFLIALLVLALIDLEHWLLPFAITIPMAIVGVGGAAIGATLPFGRALLGAGVGFAFFLAVTYAGKSLLKREAMGGGDLAFGLMAGVYLGMEKTVVMIFLGSFLGAMVSIPFLLLRRKKGSDPIPFGPFLSGGAFVAFFWGDMLIRHYVALFW